MVQTDGSATLDPGFDRIALIGNYLPRKCGLATYTTHSRMAMAARYPNLAIDTYAMDDHPGRYEYPPEVTCAIPQDERVAYSDAARQIEESGARAIWVQHEYGIYGGAAGSHLLTLLERTSLPLVITLHTVLEQPSADERRVMDALLARAARVIVMADKGREILCRVHTVDARKVELIEHGVPDRALVDTDAMKAAFGWAGRRVVLTFGLLAPNKGIETMIDALPSIVARAPDTLYVVLGATHPNLVAHEGEAYRERLQAHAKRLGMSDHITFIDSFVEQEDLLDYLQAADVYVTPYTNPAQIVSGTLSYAVAIGKPVVSTPYVHATEILGDDHGRLVDFGDVAGFAREVGSLLADDDARHALAMRAYTRGRTMIWSRNAERVAGTIADAIRAAPRRIRRPTPASDASPRILKPDFAAIERMSDGTGMLQHGIYSVPDRRHGYCIDDNARALILAARIEGLDEGTRDRWMSVYAAFVQHAWNPDTRRFRNFMAFDRSWCEDSGSEDSNGRALWALGVCAAEATMPKHRDWAASLFEQTAEIAFEFGSPRAQAFAMLGAASFLQVRSGHPVATRILQEFGANLLGLLDAARRPEWKWFEIVLAYDNARLPEALIRAGLALGNDAFIACGIETLDWIISRQTSPEGRFRAVGTESFGREYAEPLPFDQQPLEAQATVDACAAAFDATHEARWLKDAMRAYRWYLGVNDLDLPLASGADGGCFDGLTPVGVNRNQGAESILALQLATHAISALSRRAPPVAEPELRVRA